MQLSNKLTKCAWDGAHNFTSSAAGTGLVRHVCEVCRLVSFDSVDYLSTKPISFRSVNMTDLIERSETTAA